MQFHKADTQGFVLILENWNYDDYQNSHSQNQLIKVVMLFTILAIMPMILIKMMMMVLLNLMLMMVMIMMMAMVMMMMAMLMMIVMVRKMKKNKITKLISRGGTCCKPKL